MAPSTRRAKGKKPEKVEVSEEDQKPGVIYVGHIPHGFYEDQMRAYFKQFGDVLAVKVSRSKTSGNSKGYAFVKFRYAAVAKTVAETCNNYLFFTRLLKCSYRPAEEVHRDTFKRHPKKPRRKEKRLHNTDKSEADIKMADKTALKKMKRKMKSLSEAGISLDLDEVLSTPSKEKIDESKDESKTKPTKQTKDKTPKKRKRSENDDSEAEQINGNKTVESNGEDLVQPTPKRRKKSSPNTPEKIDVEIVKKTKTPPGKKAESLIKKTPESKVLTPESKVLTPESKVLTRGRKAASLIKKTPEPKVPTPGKKGASLIKKTPESKVPTPGKKAASLIKKTPEPKVATPGKKISQSSAKKDKVVVPTGVKKSPGSGKKKK